MQVTKYTTNKSDEVNETSLQKAKSLPREKPMINKSQKARKRQFTHAKHASPGTAKTSQTSRASKEVQEGVFLRSSVMLAGHKYFMFFGSQLLAVSKGQAYCQEMI